jgi:uncharacterized membrane protein
MQVVEQTTTIEAPIEIVRQAMNDLEGIPNWATVQGTVDNPQGQGVGRTYDWHFQVSGLNFKGKIEVLEQTETGLITRSTGDIDSIWTINLTALGNNSTAIRVVVEYTPPNAFVEPLADLVVQQLASPEAANENMMRFKTMVEKRARILKMEEGLTGR